MVDLFVGMQELGLDHGWELTEQLLKEELRDQSCEMIL